MNDLVFLTLVGWPVMACILFLCLPPRRALVAGMLLGTLLLPNASYALPLLVSYSKFTAVPIGLFLAAALVDGKTLLRMRLNWLDAPMVVWCLLPIASSISNGLGVYDGISGVVGQVATWGMPYMLGRAYFRCAAHLAEIAKAVFVAGLIYAPLCLLEMKGGPFFHIKLYGFYPHIYAQQFRYGSWRPSVFFVHGLWLAWFMVTASVAGICLFAASYRLSHAIGAGCLLTVTVLCRSTGALADMALGIAVFLSSRLTRWAIPVLIAVPALYIGARLTFWDGQIMMSQAAQLGDDRAQSLSIRIHLEDVLIARVSSRPLFGFGGWNRGFSERNEPGEEDEKAWAEGLWTYALVRHGYVGLACWLATHLAVAAMAYRRLWGKGSHWKTETGLLFLLVIVPLQVVHGLMVLDFGSLQYLFTGALAGVAIAQMQQPAVRYGGTIKQQHRDQRPPESRSRVIA